ncbi:hypothetical protein DXG01_005033 [Tephrocybe rancida]|nr:hypothetical protein DXG01_005033 [Tephrocybe rancida]
MVWTGISISGGRRSNYGTFTISVDGQTITTGNANSAQDSTNEVLGSVSNLVYGPHTAILTNTGGAPIDIDFVNVATQPSSSSSTMTSVTIDDADPNIQYLPTASAWSLTQNQGYMNNTLHFTNTAGASASISFTGDAVAVYGTMAPDHADVEITLDGRSKTMTGGGGGFVSLLHSQYYANNLGTEPHVLTMASAGQGGGPFMDLDAITVFSSGAPPTTPGSPQPGTGNGSAAGTSPASSTQPSGASTSKGQSFAPIIGGVVGGVVVLALLGLFLYLQRRKLNRPSVDKRDIRAPTSPKTPDLPMQGASMSMMEAGVSRPVVTQSPRRVVEAPLYPAPTYLPPPPPPSALPSPKRSANRETMHSIAPSYYSEPSYASEMSSPRSDAGLLPPLPTSPPSARLGSSRYPSRRGIDPVMMGNAGLPRRPNRRPPPLDIE